MQAMILAAGLGTRMRPLTDHTPKPLLKVAGKPLLEHQIERLIDAGADTIVINISYLAEQIQEFIASRLWPVAIRLSFEDQPLETAGGIQKALEQGDLDWDSPLLLANGDVWCDYDLAKLPPLNEDTLGHLILASNPEHNPGGDFLLAADGNVHRKPDNAESTDHSLSALTFSGISLLDPKLIPTSQISPPPLALGPLLKNAAEKGQITGEHFDGYWLDVGTPERLKQLEEKILKDQI